MNKSIWFALVLGWLVPGLGHFFMRRHRHGLIYLLAIGGLYAAGAIIAQGTAVNYQLHEYYFYCQLLAGPITITLEALRGNEAINLGESISIMRHQTGVVYAAAAGVLNLIVLCELYRRHTQPDAPGPADTMRADAVRKGANA